MMRPARTVVACALLAGCAASPLPQLYTLTDPPALPASNARASTLSVAVGPLTLPESVDRPQLVTRGPPNRLVVHDLHRWAEPLKSEIPLVLAQQLAPLLGGAQVSVHPQAASLQATYRVPVDVQRFDSLPGEAAHIEALWSVRSREGSVLAHGHAAIREPVQGPGLEPLVAAHARALGNLAQRIAKTLREAGATRSDSPPPR